jgi:hypothetical protein
MAPTPVPPRDLTNSEREILTFILSADFVGAARLRVQIPHCQVVAVWVEGLPSVDLAVPATVGKAPVEDGETSVGSEVRDRAGNYLGEILVWIEGGYLSALEYAWVTDESPARLPDVADMKLLQ